MKTRTRKTTVTFARPFHLSGFGEALPAGDYLIETDEELLEGLSFPAYRRILTVLHLRSNPSRPDVRMTVTVDANELDAALERDRTPDRAAPDRAAADRQAVDSAENEGMALQPGP